MRVIIVLLSLISINFYSQNTPRKHITYGESIELGAVGNDTKFTIVGNDSTVRVNGDEINNYVFTQPGNYLINIETKEHFTNGDCNHQTLPKEFEVIVSRTKMSFDASKILFSETIKKNKDMEGTTLTIPVFIESYDGQPVVLNDQIVEVAGIGSSLKAKLSTTSLELPVGMHLLTYTLSGKVTENAYLMFDFVDANGAIQSVSLQQPILN